MNTPQKAILLEKLKTNKEIQKLGEFKNEYGEKYIMYKENKIIWIAGDETDWESINIANTNFVFNEKETLEIDRILINQIKI